MILKWSNLLDIGNQSHLSKEELWVMWAKTNSVAKDLLTFMWVLRDLIIPRGVVKTTSIDPTFYLTRFCIGAFTHINKYHEQFYTNIEN